MSIDDEFNVINLRKRIVVILKMDSDDTILTQIKCVQKKNFQINEVFVQSILHAHSLDSY